MKIFASTALALLAATSALAAPIKIDFEGAVGYVNAIGNFYSGGTDSLGQSGPNLGVAFSSSVLGLSNDALGPYYSNAPSPLTVMFAQDGGAVMNVAAGFNGNLSFVYSSAATLAKAVNVYAGLDGAGTLLGSFDLLSNATTGCSDTAFCRFDLASLDFAGTALSVSFGGGAPNVLFDDIRIIVNANTVPEPTTSLLVIASLLGFAFTAKRRQD